MSVEAQKIVIPSDPTNEATIIAACIISESIREQLVKQLTVDYFFAPQHRVIWKGICELSRRKLSFDLGTLQRLCGEEVPTDYLQQLIDTRQTVPVNLDYHLACLHWDRIRLEASRGPIAALLEALVDTRSDPAKVMALARAVPAALDTGGELQYLEDPKALVQMQMMEIRERMKGRAIYPYGIPSFDFREDGTPRVIPGAAPSQVTIVTGIPGSGKSTWTCQMALGFARQRRRVLFGAWEMGSGISLELLALMTFGWSRTAVTTGQIIEGMGEGPNTVQLEERMHAISKYIRFFAQPFRRKRAKKTTNEANLDIIQQYIEDTGCDVFIADLWKRCLVKTSPEDEEDALMRQQAMHQETKTHGVLLQQQRAKDIEARENPKPTREGIKGSGAYLEIADTVIGIHRPALFKQVPDNTAEAILLKQRHGKWPLAVEFDWNNDQGSYKDGREVDYINPKADAAANENGFGQQFGEPRKKRHDRR